jgi:hypothetical protein
VTITLQPVTNREEVNPKTTIRRAATAVLLTAAPLVFLLVETAPRVRW